MAQKIKLKNNHAVSPDSAKCSDDQKLPFPGPLSDTMATHAAVTDGISVHSTAAVRNVFKPF